MAFHVRLHRQSMECISRGGMAPLADSEVSAPVSADRNEIGKVIGWVGLSLIAYFIITILFEAWPIALLQPAWMQKMSNVLLRTSLAIAIGALLMACAPVVSPDDIALAKRANLVRRIASWVAILYLLLIPIQIYSGVNLIRAQEQQQAGQLAQAKKAIDAIQKSSDIEQMLASYNQIPGRKPALPSRFNIPFTEARDRIVDQLRPLASRAETSYKEAVAKLWNEWITRLIRSILLCVVMFIALAAIGRKSPNHPTLLRAVLAGGRGKRPSRRSKRGSSSERLIPKEWIPDED